MVCLAGKSYFFVTVSPDWKIVQKCPREFQTGRCLRGFCREKGVDGDLWSEAAAELRAARYSGERGTLTTEGLKTRPANK